MKNAKPCRTCGLVRDHYSCIATCCKECWKARVKKRRMEKIDEVRAYDRMRSKMPHRMLSFADKQRNKRAKVGQNYERSHKWVERNVKSGALLRPLRCERCSVKGLIQAHHDDHSQKDKIMWLCPVCHAARHGELGRLGLKTGTT